MGYVWVGRYVLIVSPPLQFSKYSWLLLLYYIRQKVSDCSLFLFSALLGLSVNQGLGDGCIIEKQGLVVMIWQTIFVQQASSRIRAFWVLPWIRNRQRIHGIQLVRDSRCCDTSDRMDCR